MPAWARSPTSRCSPSRRARCSTSVARTRSTSRWRVPPSTSSGRWASPCPGPRLRRDGCRRGRSRRADLARALDGPLRAGLRRARPNRPPRQPGLHDRRGAPRARGVSVRRRRLARTRTGRARGRRPGGLACGTAGRRCHAGRRERRSGGRRRGPRLRAAGVPRGADRLDPAAADDRGARREPRALRAPGGGRRSAPHRVREHGEPPPRPSRTSRPRGRGAHGARRVARSDRVEPPHREPPPRRARGRRRGTPRAVGALRDAHGQPRAAAWSGSHSTRA